jgi:prepilin-type N-terminal cleavage/methylation domain-containing protein
MHKNSGYTLVEVLTVIAIIAIVAGIVLPNVVAWLPRYRLSSGAEEIQSTLQLARLGAIKQNTSATVTFSTATHTFWVRINGQTIKSGKMPAGIMIDSVTSPASQVEFDSRGLANGSTGNILVKNNIGGAKTISVNIVGIASIQ